MRTLGSPLTTGSLCDPKDTLYELLIKDYTMPTYENSTGQTVAPDLTTGSNLLKNMLYHLITNLTPEEIGSVEESLVCEWAEDSAEAMCCYEDYAPPVGAEMLLKLLQDSTSYCPSREKHFLNHGNIRKFLTFEKLY